MVLGACCVFTRTELSGHERVYIHIYIHLPFTFFIYVVMCYTQDICCSPNSTQTHPKANHYSKTLRRGARWPPGFENAAQGRSLATWTPEHAARGRSVITWTPAQNAAPGRSHLGARRRCAGALTRHLGGRKRCAGALTGHLGGRKRCTWKIRLGFFRFIL